MKCLFSILLSVLGISLIRSAPVGMEEGFQQPPPQTQPWCYWYWISDNISKEGITKDLEAMKRFGIGEALIGNIFQDNQPVGPVKVLSEEWWSHIEHAIREGGRIGVNIGLFNCPGWSQSGGPWIRPEHSMRHVMSSEIRVKGPMKFKDKLPVPGEHPQDIAVLAFPAPRHDGDRFESLSPKLQSRPALRDAAKLVDGNPDTVVEFPPGVRKAPVSIDLELAADLTARTLRIFPSADAFGADAELQAEQEGKEWKTIVKFKCDRSNPAVGVGPNPRGPVTVSFPPTTSRKFRLVFANFFGRTPKLSLSEIELSSRAMLPSYIEKQLGKMHPTPLPLWDAYVWPSPAEPDDASLVVPEKGVVDISSHLKDGILEWDVPAGDWVILRNCMIPTGMTNAPSSPEGRGLEVDKMNRELAQKHFEAFVGQLLKRMPASGRKALTRVVADSYEMGSQNWTDGFGESFQQTYGYDPKPWLPVLSGRIVGSAARSERFLWDLRRLVADRVATDYVGGLQESSRKHGLGLWLENYGHWGFPGEFLKYGSHSDRIGGEFWVTGDLGSVECRAASSCANTYGKPFVSAESFTGGPAFQNSPSALKARGDWSFCEGVNHAVMHVYIHQPSETKIPGINAPWGTEFNRHNTWFEQGREWMDYQRRCAWMLQQGWRVADVAYFIGEDAPKMTGIRTPALPAGRDFDYINAEVIERDLSVKDGMLVLPHGVQYKLLVLPPEDTMRPALLKKIQQLVLAGATVVGKPPVASPSMKDYPACDEEVRRLSFAIWGDADVSKPGELNLGKGRVIWGKELAEVFNKDGFPQDVAYPVAAADAKFLHTHRASKEADIYFISNQKSRMEKVTCAFRITGMQPELWDPVTGTHRALTDYRDQDGVTLVPLMFDAAQSWFVVFRKPVTAKESSLPNFPELKTVQTLEGSWQVGFNQKRGGPGVVGFDALVDWISRPEEGIKFYSGTAVYRKRFKVDESSLQAGNLYLDLGIVRDLASVRLNGKDLGTVWTAPWRLDIHGIAKAGDNELEIAVTNPWNNRLVGDDKLPADKRITSISLRTVKDTSPLLSAGLLGPVTIQSAP
jgi:hypothetical protein